MKAKHILGALLVMSAVGDSGCAGCAGEEQEQEIDSLRAALVTDPAVHAQLHDLALAMSRERGVEVPGTMTAVLADDHRAAEAAISGAILSDEEHGPVYVVQMTGGTFTALRHPPEAPAPHGNVLTVTFDARTLRVTDVGYDDVAPSLPAIHPTVVDLLQVN